jgi:hypothetical protein
MPKPVPGFQDMNSVLKKNMTINDFVFCGEASHCDVCLRFRLAGVRKAAAKADQLQ